MQRILLATDFSTRSERALRRATLLARQHACEIIVVHVVDDDAAPRLVEAHKRDATALLEELAASVRDMDSVRCTAHVAVGEPFEQINAIAGQAGADLIVIGPHRRQILRDVFLGTTAERTIRQARLPVLMANAAPTQPYGRVLVATDLSECSLDAIQATGRLGLLQGTRVTALYAYSLVEDGPILRSVAPETSRGHREQELAHAAEAKLKDFLKSAGHPDWEKYTPRIELSPADTIHTAARLLTADLIVASTHGRKGVEKLLLGSVVEEVLRTAETDVLVVPPARP